MRVKDFVKMYRGMKCVEVEIESGKLKTFFFIRGCESCQHQKIIPSIKNSTLV